MGEFPKTCHWKRWNLTRNCAMQPRNLALHIAAIALVNAMVGTVFMALGFPGVAVACAIQMVFVAGATWLYACHAVDGERVQIDIDLVWIETVQGSDVHVYSFHPAWVWIEWEEGCALVLRSGGLRIPVGYHVSEPRRLQFVDEFSATLALARAPRPLPEGIASS